ncbi:hypothetical protein lerEdw1_001422, partial [Lerista edwardsae]
TLVDGPQNGASSRPWDIKVQGPQMFQEDTKKCRVPHSSLVKIHENKLQFHISKVQHLFWKRQQDLCDLPRREKVATLQPTDDNLVRVFFHVTLKVVLHTKEVNVHNDTQSIIMFKRNNVYEFISEHPELNFPRELLSEATGENIFKDQNTQVYPLVDFPYPEISLASQRAIAEHNAAFASTSRILQQRQTIELIPVTEVRYQYTGKHYLYYVYGMENKVHALDYPERYCCGCTII